MLKRICCYCPEPHPLAPRPGDEDEPDGISHGMCAKAYKRETETLELLALTAFRRQVARGDWR